MRLRRQCRCPAPGKEKTRRAYLWAYSTTQSPDLRAVVYDFAITRVIRIPTLLTPSVQGWQLVAVSTISRNSGDERSRQMWRLRGMAMRCEWRNCGIGITLARHGIAYTERSGADVVWCTVPDKHRDFLSEYGLL
jgi:hypothetical protein